MDMMQHFVINCLHTGAELSTPNEKYNKQEQSCFMQPHNDGLTSAFCSFLLKMQLKGIASYFSHI
jgi:hypothetical protein